jgi:glycosyltransferase involved in cell wall biosynthesis
VTADGGAQRRLIHVITPGDHYSPSTGSATVSVVHGLSAARPSGTLRPAVVVAKGTYPDRYDSADIVEFPQRAAHRWDRYTDALRSRLGATRSRARERYRAALEDQAAWDPAYVIGHNAVQLIPSIDAQRHVPVLYAHNDLLRTYTKRESSESLSQVSVIVAVSSYLADQLHSSLPRHLRDRVAVVVNGVDAVAFARPARATGQRLEVSFLGRMVPDKGADVLIEALALLDRDDIHATVIGSQGFDPLARPSRYELALRRTAAPLGPRVEFLPFQSRPRVTRLLGNADVAVVPSRWPEPCSLTVLEGMAAGAAVIASDIGGIPEASGGAALLVPPDDAEALADALAALADDRAELHRLQVASQRRARERDWSVVASELAVVLNQRA